MQVKTKSLCSLCLCGESPCPEFATRRMSLNVTTFQTTGESDLRRAARGSNYTRQFSSNIARLRAFSARK